MTWRFVSGCATGTSHIKLGKPCDDSARCTLHATHPPTLSLFVSDGAGSVAFGGMGASIATVAAESALKTVLAENPTLTFSSRLVDTLIQAVVSALQQAATEKQVSIKAFACTFLAFIAQGSQSIAIQIGDGGIVVEHEGLLQMALPPHEVGEYVNMTHFITDRHLDRKIRWKAFSTQIAKVALFSDGLERLVVDFAKQSPHQPFFNHFFSILQTADTRSAYKHLAPALTEFLNSAAVNERTDDDKSLALAIHTAL